MLNALATLTMIGLALASWGTALAQTPPSLAELAVYRGLHAAAASGNISDIERLVRDGADLDNADSNG